MTIEPGADSLEVVCDTEEETDRLGRAIASVLEPGAVVGLVGPLGAGKTRLVRAVAEAMGAEPSAISSPTFVLIHEYDASLPITHFDAYRLAGAAEFEAIGAGEYFERGGVSLVEWADLVADALPVGSWRVAIDVLGDSRRFRIEGPGPAVLGRIAAASSAIDTQGSAS